MIPLTQLTRKGQAYVWGALSEDSFIELKKMLTSASVLIFLNLSELLLCIMMLR